MNYQSPPDAIVLALLEKCGMSASVDYYAWPQVFPNTTGPYRGIGGQAMSLFTVEAWVSDSGAALLLCAGCWSKEANFSPFMTATKWREIPRDLVEAHRKEVPNG